MSILGMIIHFLLLIYFLNIVLSSKLKLCAQFQEETKKGKYKFFKKYMKIFIRYLFAAKVTQGMNECRSVS